MTPLGQYTVFLYNLFRASTEKESLIGALKCRHYRYEGESSTKQFVAYLQMVTQQVTAFFRVAIEKESLIGALKCRRYRYGEGKLNKTICWLPADGNPKGSGVSSDRR